MGNYCNRHTILILKINICSAYMGIHPVRMMASSLLHFSLFSFINIAIVTTDFLQNLDLTQKQSPRGVPWKVVLKVCSKFTGKHPCRSAISITLQSNFIEITLRHGVLLQIYCIFSEHLFLKTILSGCFCRLLIFSFYFHDIARIEKLYAVQSVGDYLTLCDTLIILLTCFN